VVEDLTSTATHSIAQARTQSRNSTTPAFRRVEEDVLIQIGIGRFFAAKIRCGMLYEIFKQTHNTQAGRLALAEYRKAREAWNSMAERAATVYLADISYGETPMRRGHWKDRLFAIDSDIAAMQASVLRTSPLSVEAALSIDRPQRASVPCYHAAPPSFHPGDPLLIQLILPTPATSVHLFYRRVNHAERWQSLPMESSGSTYKATIPGAYTQTQFPLQYYFELQSAKAAWLYPAFNATLSNQPYYVVPRA
jgi:hypothetical protein